MLSFLSTFLVTIGSLASDASLQYCPWFIIDEPTLPESMLD